MDDQATQALGLSPIVAVQSLCACAPDAMCLYHDKRMTEHRQMYDALRRIARGRIEGDPGMAADAALVGVAYWHPDAGGPRRG